MHRRQCILGFILGIHFQACVTRDPDESEDVSNVTGYLNYKGGATLVTVILEDVTWYEARVICENAGYGRLDDITGFHIKTSMVAAVVRKNNLDNATFWTANFRPDVTSADWFMVNSDECKAASLTFATTVTDDATSRCATNRYVGQKNLPVLEYQNCSSKFWFVCTEWKENETNFTTYPGYDFDSNPQHSVVYTEDYDADKCLDNCAESGFCVGVSYNASSNECRRLNVNFGFQRFKYTIHSYHPNVTHYTKLGNNVTLLEDVEYISSLEQTFECPTTTSSTTSPSLAPSTLLVSSTPALTATQEIISTQIYYETIFSTIYITSTLEPITVTALPSLATPITTSASSPTTTVTGTTAKTSTATTPRTSPFSPTTPKLTSTLSTTSKTAGNQSTTARPLTATSAYTKVTSKPTKTITKMPLCKCTGISANKSSLNETEIEERVQILVKNLTVARKGTFKFKSTLVCSEDNRTSSRAMGLVAGLVMCFVFGPIIISDIFKVIRHRSMNV